MTYFLNSVFVWRISTTAVKINDTDAAVKVYQVTKNDEVFTVTDITSDCAVDQTAVDATSGLHNLQVRYTPATDVNIHEFIVSVYNTGNQTENIVLRGKQSTKRHYETGNTFINMM